MKSLLIYKFMCNFIINSSNSNMELLCHGLQY